jgi:hypothetical protein
MGGEVKQLGERPRLLLPGRGARDSDRAVASAGAVSAEEGRTREEHETPLREEHSTVGSTLEPMLRDAGFEIIEARYAPTRMHAAYLCRLRARRTLDPIATRAQEPA